MKEDIAMASETLSPEITLLGGQITEIGRDLRPLRLQVDNIARLATNDQRFTGIDGRLSGIDQRFTGVEGRLAAVEQSIHDLIGETARGFGQQQQRLTRIEQRFDAVDAGLGAIREGLAANTRLLTDLLGREV
jgi:hypothetical protein